MDALHDFVRSEDRDDDGAVQNLEFVPFARPWVVQSLRIRTVINLLPVTQIPFEVDFEAFELRELIRHFEETKPRLVGQPAALACRVGSS